MAAALGAKSADRSATPPVAPLTGAAGRGPPVVDRGSVRHDEVRAGRWEVRGIAKVDRQVDVGRAELHGTVTVGGALVADELVGRVALEVRGGLTVGGRLRLHGTADIGAAAALGEAAFDGVVRIAGELSARGSLSVGGSVHAPSVRCELLRLKGAATVPGLIAATTVDAVLGRDSVLGVIRARGLRLRGPAPNPVQQLLGPEVSVRLERIEADSVFLEGVRAGSVRAREITLGRQAHVGAIEGTVVRAHPSSRIGPESWSRPPLGLTR